MILPGIYKFCPRLNQELAKKYVLDRELKRFQQRPSQNIVHFISVLNPSPFWPLILRGIHGK